jgi:amino acid transporter
MNLGGEVMNPQKSIPLSIISSLLICCCVYCGVSMVLGLMIPYYLIDQNAPMPDAFHYVHWDWARYLVAVGALVSLSTWYDLI